MSSLRPTEHECKECVHVLRTADSDESICAVINPASSPKTKNPGTFVPGFCESIVRDNQVRAAGFLAAWSRIVVSTLLGTCSNVSGSMEYDARPLESERMAVA
jgi:hypothetical protein